MDNHENGHFIIPVKYFVVTLISLLILTVITVAVAQVDLGALNIYVAMGVAVIKACFVIFIFMGVKWEEGFNKVVLFGTFLFLGLFIAITMFDVFTRGHVYPEEERAFELGDNSPVKLVKEYSDYESH